MKKWPLLLLPLFLLLLSNCQSTPPEEAQPASLAVAPMELSLRPGETATLTVASIPAEASTGEVSWESSDDSVATVSAEGVVRGVSVGEATVTVRVAEGLSATATVRVSRLQPRRISLERSSLLLLPGERQLLKVTLLPEGAALGEVSWRSEDDDVFVVDDRGRITARNPGTATLTVSSGTLHRRALVVVKERLTAAESEVIFTLVPEAEFLQGVEESEERSAGPLWLSDRPVTAELWQTVRRWATTDAGNAARADGGALYEIPSAGRKGNDGAPEKSLSHPVTRASWRSAVVWLNALTEYFNAHTETELEPVYYTDSSAATPLRRASRAELIRRDVLYSQDNPYVKEDADGFRLPRSLEWELAARYILDGDLDGSITDPGEAYPGDYATGADAPYNSEAQDDFDGDGRVESTGDVALFEGNAEGSTAEVAGKEPNALGLYDMSGNVFEWVFEWHPSQLGEGRTIRGGSWASPAAYVQLGLTDHAPPYFEDGITGFRVARNAARIRVRNVLLVEGAREVRLGGSLALEARVIPENAYDRDLLWESSDPAVASVSPTGVVTGEGVGSATISVRTVDGGHRASTTVEVTVPVQGISLNLKSAAIPVGEQISLTATITPPDATHRGLSWQSGEPGVASVNAQGVVKGVAPGTTTIRVSTTDGRFSQRFTAVVQDRRSIGGAEVTMSEVPALRFPQGIDDNRTGSVASPFWVATTEITYRLWEEVRQWATAEERGEEAYTFDTAGRAGGAWPDPAGTGPQHPVTELSWASAAVWTNALTEFYNSRRGADLRPVYYRDRGLTEPLRDATRLVPGQGGSPPLYLDSGADGLRLLTDDEWELAARYRGSDSREGAIEFPIGSEQWWSPGNYASGAAGSVDDRDATLAVAVVEEPPGSTAPVGSRGANTLGLFDMSGNISEWTLRQQEDGSLSPVRRGGSWFSDLSELRVSAVDPLSSAPGVEEFTAGLRVGRGTFGRELSSLEERELNIGQVPPEDQAIAPPAGAQAEKALAEITPPPESGPGSVEELSTDTLEIPLVHVPAGAFPFGLADGEVRRVGRPFLMGKTEVTYGLWREVHSWAENAGYRIEDEGAIHPEVSPGSDLENYPVAEISWWSAVAWTNALTQYINAKNRESLEPVYYMDRDFTRPVRSSASVGGATGSEAPYAKEGATGFRLPTSEEWELAARWAGEEPLGEQFSLSEESGPYWNPGRTVSGATESVEQDEEASIFAVFGGGRPEPVASRQPNALGIFDMSGNVAEMCYDWRPFMVGKRRVRRGGSYASELQEIYIGKTGIVSPTNPYLPMNGLRVVRTASPEE